MIIAVANQKGGVGKTTTSINISAGFAKAGKKVLLVDLDPQSNSSLSFIEQERITLGSFEFLTDPVSSPAAYSYDTEIDGLEIIPSKINLAKLESKMVADFDAIYRLKDRIDPLRDRYDLIIFDTPPTLGLITSNALVAASDVIIPIQSSFYALGGTDELLETIKRVQARPNPDLKILGVLVTLVDKRTSLSKDVEAHIRDVFGRQAFKTTISRSVRLEEAPAHRESIFSFAPKSSGATEYKEICLEILKEVDSVSPDSSDE